MSGKGGWRGGAAYIMEYAVVSRWISGWCNLLTVVIKLLVQIARGLAQFVSSGIVIVVVNFTLGRSRVIISAGIASPDFKFVRGHLGKIDDARS